MKILVGGLDVTSEAVVSSFKLSKSDDLSKSFGLTIRTTENTIMAGQEIVVYNGFNDEVKEFGGIITSVTKKPLRPDLMDVAVSTDGYEVIAARRTVTDTYTNVVAGTIVHSIIDNILLGDGIQAGVIEDGIIIISVDYVCKSVYEIVKDLAQSCGYFWWIDNDKKLHFRKDKPVGNALYDLDDDISNPNRLTKFEYPEFTEDISNYCNKVFLTGKLKSVDNTNIVAIAVNANEVLRMQAIYGGTGVIGKVFSNDNLDTQADADEAARKLLQDMSAQPIVLKFKTPVAGLDTNQYLNVNIPILGLNNCKYTIDNIDVSCRKDGELTYEITCHNTITINGVPKPSKKQGTWVDDIGQLKGGSISGAVGSGSGGGYAAVSKLIATEEYDNGFICHFEDEANPTSIVIVEDNMGEYMGLIVNQLYSVPNTRKTGNVPTE